MTQNNNGAKVVGLILIAFPIIALLFGSNEPSMQTDQAAIVMTGMIFVGIITLANANKKSPTPNTTQHYQPIEPVTQSSPSKKFCPYCGTQITIDDARFCPRCGKEYGE